MINPIMMLIKRVKYCAILKSPVSTSVFGNFTNSIKNLINETEKTIIKERNPGFDKKCSLSFNI